MRRTRIAALLAATLMMIVAGCGGAGTDEGTDAPAPTAPLPEGSTDADAQDRTVSAPAVGAPTAAPGALPAYYAADFLATAGKGFDINGDGTVIGRAYVVSARGPFELPPQENVVWLGGKRTALPPVSGFDPGNQHPLFINAQGQIAGAIGNGMESYAALWTPSGSTYVGRSLGAPAGTTNAMVQGFDALGRIVGWATTGGAIPTRALPYMWSQSTGMVDLRELGHPDEMPLAMSPGGMVVTTRSTYRLGDPASRNVFGDALPSGFMGPGTHGSAVNDSGDQAHLLVSTSSQNLAYPFRRSSDGTWQQLGPGTGSFGRYGMGRIDAARNVTFTALNTGFLAPGPAGIGKPLANDLSPAYGGAGVISAGAKNDRHEVLAQVMIGRSPRLMKLVPAASCATSCIVSSAVVMNGNLAGGPPSTCIDDGKTYDMATATVTMTNEAGAPLANVTVHGRFLDDYWANQPVSGTTDGAGKVSWTYEGVCGTGAIAFLVDEASLSTRVFDRTTGVVTASVIPGATAPTPTNLAPVANAVVTCADLACTFDGTRSSDDVAIASHEWRDRTGKLLSTTALWSGTYPSGETQTIALKVYDDAGLSHSQTVTFNPNVWPVTTANVPVPVASAQCFSGRVCTFSSSRSADPDGTIVKWVWTDGSGQTMWTGPADFSYSYKRTGKTTVTLTVTDDDGLTASTTVAVAIKK